MIQLKPISIWDNPETKETVRRMWVDEQRSYNEIGAVLSATRAQVAGYVRRTGLPKRTPKLFSTRIKGPPSPSRPPVDKFTNKVAVEAEETVYDSSPALDTSGSPYTTLTVQGGMCRWIAV